MIGIYNQNELQLQEIVFYGLYALQHRGQESAGIAVTDGNSISYHKGMGLVAEVFDEQALARLAGGKAAIGHVRYATDGDRMYANAQPLVTKYKKGSMALTHDGRLVNAGCIRKQLEEDGAIFQTNLDIEVIANLIAKTLIRGWKKRRKTDGYGAGRLQSADYDGR